MSDVQVMIDIHWHLAAPREAVYRAFIDEEQVAVWFGPHGGWVMPGTVSIDARPGGHRRLTMVTYSGAMTWSIETTFSEVIENQRLAGHEKIIGIPGFEGVDHLTVGLDFFDEAGGTRIELRSGPCPPEMEAPSREFWLQSFSKLDAFLTARANEQRSGG
ncbi:MAG: hypothetical protein QOF58_509 [Pseudonocardiales bacterium]|jgi:uncharacterized protein YndB with AHSA1/START domain|nr:hypothetical protein [Pseudonocardiales bacterium]